MPSGLRHVVVTFVLCFAVLLSGCAAQQDDSLAALEQSFQTPPDDCRIMMRWWWFGPAVTKPELQRELEQMKANGIGGVEIATLYPLALDDPATGFHNQRFLSAEHLENLRFAATTARQLSLRVDITLGSGWPFGGPEIPVTQAAGELRVELKPIPAGSDSIAVPDIGTGERLIAAFLAPVKDGTPSLPDARQVSIVANARVEISPPLPGAQDAIFFISSRTGMMVKRAALAAEGFVLDHYDGKAIEAHLSATGDRLLGAFGDHPPYAVFSDSLEDEGSNWTPDFLEQFRARRGYDLTPYLPALIGDAGPSTSAVRHDWGRTLTELAEERFLRPLHSWAQQHHTFFRSQSYGTPPVTLSSNRFADLPEGEGKASLRMWREFSDLRWAASAGHLFGHAVISSETWTWLHSPAFRATPLDLKAEADLHFLQGINQLVGHGWPYSPPEAREPGWRMYAAAALDDHNPWFFVMPELARYLQRVSFALRLGKPANDVALLLPNDDIWATFTAKTNPANSRDQITNSDSSFSIDESLQSSAVSQVIPQLLDAGFNLDFIDANVIDTVGIPYPILILPDVHRLPQATYEKIEQYARHGGVVIAVQTLPSTSPGLLGADSESNRIQEISRQLFSGSSSPGHFIPDISKVADSLPAYLAPDVVISPKTPRIGFIHRSLSSGDLYFIVNTSNQPHRVHARFRQNRQRGEWWDPMTGKILALSDSSVVDLDLQPYESRLIFFTGEEIRHEKQRSARSVPSRTIDLSTNWSLNFSANHQTIRVPRLHSWSDDAAFKYYSGLAVYERTFDLTDRDRSPQLRAILDFGAGTPLDEPNPLPHFNMKAYLEAPVRDAAEVFVNGKSAGFIWHPPYILDIAPFLATGKNNLRIVVGNTAINALAGRTLPDYRLLNQKYGERFTPQDMGNLQPLPSGILQGLKLNLFLPHAP